MAKNTYRILGQGQLDGACFLYAIANSMLCLTNRTHKQVRQKRWSEMISFLNAGDFLDGSIGTANFDDNFDLLERVAYECISRLDPGSKYVVETRNHLSGCSNLDQLVTKDAVMLFPTLEHWYCLVDTQDKLAYLACSAAWQSKDKYREDTSPRLSRTYNTTIALKKLKVYQGQAILISRTSKRPSR